MRQTSSNFNQYELAYYLTATCEFMLRYIAAQSQDPDFDKEIGSLQKELVKVMDKFNTYDVIIDG